MDLTRRGLLVGAGGWPTWLGATDTAAGGTPESAISLLLVRLSAHYAATLDPGQAPRWLRAQASDGRWPDIDYASRRSPDWSPLAHMHRLRTLAAAWARPAHPLAGSAELRSAIERGLGAWLAAQPRSTNWWFNVIGPQLALMPVLVLMHEQIEGSLARSARSLLVAPDEVPRAHAAGQNLVWLASQQLVRGALSGQADGIDAASRRVAGELSPRRGEGVQVDWGFHQHGAQLYTGGYGLRFLVDACHWTEMLAGTPWQWPQRDLVFLANFALEGLRPLVRGTWLDWHARGREIARAPRAPVLQPLSPALMSLAGRLRDTDPTRSTALRSFAEAVRRPQALGSWTGNKHFWRSDTMVHQTAGGLVSVKAMSSRSTGTESGDLENRLGYWLPFGTTFVVRHGAEYEGLQPVLDWSRLPGTTAPASVPTFSGLLRGGQAATGGASDGRSGMVRLVLERELTRALKTWFLDGSSLVALSCAIHSRHAAPVATTIDQRRVIGPLVGPAGHILEDRPDITLASPRWLWHDGVTYESLDGGAWRIQRTERRGSWQRVAAAQSDALITSAVLTITREHGVAPEDQTVAYRVWLGAPRAQDVASMPAVEVLSNTLRLQAVRHRGGLIQAALHAPGRIQIDPLRWIDVDRPVLLQWRETGAGAELTLADPAGRTGTVDIVLGEDGRGALHRQAVSVPASGGEAEVSAVLRLTWPA